MVLFFYKFHYFSNEVIGYSKKNDGLQKRQIICKMRNDHKFEVDNESAPSPNKFLDPLL